MYHYYHVSAQGIGECVINVHSSSSSSYHYKQIHDDLFTKCANLVQSLVYTYKPLCLFSPTTTSTCRGPRLSGPAVGLP